MNSNKIFFFIFIVFQVFFCILLSILVDIYNYDIGQTELNFWYLEYLDNNINYFGSNWYWIILLDNLALLPIKNTADIIIILFICKLIQFSLVYYSSKSLLKSEYIYFLLCMPTALYFSSSLGRSSIDWALIYFVTILGLSRSKMFLFALPFTAFHKFFITLIAGLSLIQTYFFINKKIFIKSLFIISFCVTYIFDSYLLDYLNSQYQVASFGNNSFLQSNIETIFDYYYRCLQLILPPIFYHFTLESILFSIEFFVYIIFFIKFRNFFRLFDFLVLNFYLIFSLPFIYNGISSARYLSILLLYFSVCILFRRSTFIKFLY